MQWKWRATFFDSPYLDAKEPQMRLLYTQCYGKPCWHCCELCLIFGGIGLSVEPTMSKLLIISRTGQRLRILVHGKSLECNLDVGLLLRACAAVINFFRILLDVRQGQRVKVALGSDYCRLVMKRRFIYGYIIII